MPNTPELPRRISVDDQGPLLIEGPVEITCADGRVAVSDRFVVAVCTCRRSRMYPWCDTSHRRRTHGEEAHTAGSDTARAPGDRAVPARPPRPDGGMTASDGPAGRPR
ncbi:CDGSH iron-sulfur domain-containing protein [Streptomyces clavifer]|uniref:CDGSH iron-sulfur domain-containing protein n=1 Tax=Streptomyces clavifer TaxID=68188 RepID=UPI00352E3404